MGELKKEYTKHETQKMFFIVYIFCKKYLSWTNMSNTFCEFFVECLINVLKEEDGVTMHCLFIQKFGYQGNSRQCF